MSTQWEDIRFVSIYVPNIGATKYIKQILPDLNGEIDSNTEIVGDFKGPITSMDRSSRWKINQKSLALSDTLDQVNLIDIYKTFHPKLQNTLSSQVLMEHSPG